MDHVNREWQDRGYVLKLFGSKADGAKKAYRKFVKKGIDEGPRPDLVGGGLVRSMGGWSNVVSMQRHGEKEASDPRILGSGEFVERVIKEAEFATRRQFSEKDRAKETEKVIIEMCREAGISVQEIRTGSRRRPVSKVRFQIAKRLFVEYGLPMAEIARKTGVTTSAVVKKLNQIAEVN